MVTNPLTPSRGAESSKVTVTYYILQKTLGGVGGHRSADAVAATPTLDNAKQRDTQVLNDKHSGGRFLKNKDFKLQPPAMFHCFSGSDIVAVALTVTVILADMLRDEQSLGQQGSVACHPE